MTQSLKCSQCHYTKLRKEFYQNRRQKSGRDNLCKKCRRLVSRGYYLGHRQAILNRIHKNYHRLKEATK